MRCVTRCSRWLCCTSRREGPSGLRCCPQTQTAAPGIYPDLKHTETEILTPSPWPPSSQQPQKKCLAVAGRPTDWQEAEAVGGHGELVETVEGAQLPGKVAQLVVVRSQILQGHTAVQAVREGHELVHGHIQSLQLQQVTDLWKFNTHTRHREWHERLCVCELCILKAYLNCVYFFFFWLNRVVALRRQNYIQLKEWSLQVHRW